MQSRMNLVLVALIALAVLVGTATTAVAAITIGGGGDVTPALPWVATTYGHVGDTVVGLPAHTLKVDNTDANSNLISKKGYIGFNANVIGTATVTGKGSTWTKGTATYLYLYVGEKGTGTLNVTSGGYVESKMAYIGNYADSTGYVLVSGTEDDTDSWWENTSSCYVGKTGHGELLVENGGDVSIGGTCYVGSTGDEEGEVKVTGDGSTMSTGTLYVGHNGIGTMNIEDHGLVTSSSAMVAFGGSETDVATVTGAGSKWKINGALIVGLKGIGELNIENGGTVESTDGYIGKQATTTYTGTGTVNVDGATSTWTASKAIYVSYAPGGVATLNLVNNGTVSAQTLYASPSNLTGTGTINTRGMVCDIDLAFDSTNGLSQTFSMGGPTVSLNMSVPGDNGDLGAGYQGTGTLTIDGLAVNSISGYVGFMGGSTGTATVTGAGSWTMSSKLYLGQYGTGTLYVTDGGSVTNAAGYMGFATNYGAATGTATVDGAGSIWTNTGTLTLGSKSSTYAASGTLYLDNEGTLCTNKVQASATQGGTGIAKVYFDGGVLQAYNAAQTAWLTLGSTPHTDSGVWIEDGGAIFDTAGYDMGIAVALQEDSGSLGGGLTKKGAGTLTLSKANTYTGDTIVDEGTLSLAFAYLDDASAVKIDFGAVLDLTHGLTDTIESLYFNGFQQSSGLYGAGNSGGYISGTGSLLVTIPEPSTLVLLATGLLGLLAYAWRKQK